MYIFNSFFLASITSLLTLLFVIPAAYSYARFDFPAKNLTLYLLLAVNMFSGPVLIIPLYKLLRALSLLNTYYAMIVPGIAFLIPTSIWLLKSYFQNEGCDIKENPVISIKGLIKGASQSHDIDEIQTYFIQQFGSTV